MIALQETFVSYVPEIVLRRLAVNPEALTAPIQDHLQAAVLFADISGFTPLTERLAQKGPIGAEELNRHLNAYFGQMIEQIGLHGGDIIKFAGDALLAIWPATSESLATATHRAAQCSLAILEKLSYYAADDVRLTLHIGIGAGELISLHVGGVNGYWEFLVAGQPLSQMALAEVQAKSGEVCISSEGWTLIQDYYQGTSLESGVVRLDRVRVPLEPNSAPLPILMTKTVTALRGYISPGVLARLDAGQGQWLAELRRVTVLFVGLPPLDDLKAAALEKMQSCTETIQGVLSIYEGTLRQVMMDDKGIVAIAAFGVPPLSHEDDTVRGVQAALAIQTKLQNLGFDCKIGVTTGRVYCGTVGSDRRREYTVLGDTVNLSARLMGAAKNHEILCDETTYLAAKERLHFQALEAIRVKGKTQPISIYRPISQSTNFKSTESSQYQSQIIGRDTEIAQLGAQLQALLESNHSGLVIISGEPGIGKSRLVEDFVAAAVSAGAKAFFNAADAIEKSTPYYVWRRIFSQLFELNIEDKSALEAQRQKVLDFLAVEPELLALAPFLNVVLPLDLPETEVTTSISGKERAEKTHNFLAQLLQLYAKRSPTVLVLEDAHWLDSASWTLALQVSRQVHPILLLISMRPVGESQPDEYHQMMELPHIQHLQLQALNESDAVQLVCENLGVDALPESVANLIAHKAHGNPFFSEEIAYALRDAGLILIADGKCQLAPGAPAIESLNLPDTVQGIVTSRIDRLPPSVQLTLKVASVIGRAFGFKILREVHPIEADKEQLNDYLQKLEIFDLTPLMTPEPDLAYIFKHIITQEVSYNLMLFAQRRQLHQQVAQWYEKSYGSDFPEYYEILAYHYEQGQIWQKALDYLVKAGQKAQQAYVNPEALAHYNRALTVCQELGNAVERATLITIYAGIGQVHFLLSEFHPSIAAYQKMLEQACISDDKCKQAEALYNIGYGFFWAHEFEQALEYSQQAYSLALEIDYKNMLAASTFVMGYIHAVTSKLEESMGCFSQGINISKEIEDKAQEGFNTFMLGLVYNWKGEYETALQLGDRGVEIGQAYNVQIVWLMSLWERGITACGKGNYGQAFTDLELGIELSDRLGDKVWKSRILNTLGWLYGELYNLETAIRYNQEGLEIALQIGDPEIIRNAEINLGDFYLLQGDFPTATNYLEKVYRDSQESGKWGEEWMKWRYLQHCCHSLGELRLIEGDAQSALTLAQECLQLAEPTATRKNIIKAWRLMGEAFLAQGKISQAQEFLEKALTLAQEIGNPSQLWKTYHTLGDFYWQSEQIAQAAIAYQSAIQIIEHTASQLQSVEVKQTFLTASPVKQIRDNLSKTLA